MKPLGIDLFCGLGGFTEGLIAENFEVIGFDIERHHYGDATYPAQLVLQDVLTLHGSQFKDAALIVASPPCQEFSYMAMPWSKAKAKQAAILADPEERKRLTALFDACFRIQREACEAAGHHIPLIVENVRGAQKWVGRARWNYGSFYLWGDVPALMPIVTKRRMKFPADCGPRMWKDREYVRLNDGNASAFHLEHTGFKSQGLNWSDQSKRGQDFTRVAAEQRDDIKNSGGSWFAIAHNGTSGHGNNPDGRKTTGHVNQRDGHSHTRHLTNQAESDAVKNGGDWFGSGADCSLQRRAGSKSNARKAASAAISKIPLPLSRYIAKVFKPMEDS